MESVLCARGLAAAAAAAATGARRRSGGEEISLSMALALALRALAAWLDEDLICSGWEGPVLWQRGGGRGRSRVAWRFVLPATVRASMGRAW